MSQTNYLQLSGIASVREFGAAGNGIDDDAGKIGMAIQQLSPNGGIVEIPVGTYRLGSSPSFGGASNITIQVHPGTTFTGVGTMPAASGSNQYFTPGQAPTGMSNFIGAGTGSLAFSSAGVATATIPTATAAAWVVQDAALNAFWTTDTRTSTNGVNAHTIGNPNVSLASATFTNFHQVVNATYQVTLTGVTTVANMLGLGFGIQVPTILSASAAVTTASTFVVQGGPTLSGGSTLNDSIAMQITGGGNIGLQIDSIFTANGSSSAFGVNVQPTFPGTTTTSDLWGIRIQNQFPAGTYSLSRGGDIHAVLETFPVNVTCTGAWVQFGNDTMTVNGTMSGTTLGASHYTALWRGITVGSTGNVTTEAVMGFQAPLNAAGTLGTIYGILFNTVNPWNALIGGVAPIVFQSNGGLHNFDPTLSGTTAATGTTWNGIQVAAATFSVTGATAISNATGVNLMLIRQPTISSATANLTITNEATLVVGGAPTAAGANPAAVINLFNIHCCINPVTVQNGATTVYGGINVASHTISLNTATAITSTNGVAAMHLGQVTVNQLNGAVSVTNAATLDIVGPPIAGGSVTLTNLYSLRVQSGQLALPSVANGAAGTPTFTNTLPTGGQTTTRFWLKFFDAATNTAGFIPVY